MSAFFEISTASAGRIGFEMAFPAEKYDAFRVLALFERFHGPGARGGAGRVSLSRDANPKKVSGVPPEGEGAALRG